MFTTSSHPTGTRQGLTARRSLTAREPRRSIPSNGHSASNKFDLHASSGTGRTPACEYAKPRKPARKNTGHEMCDLARDMNRAMRVVETTDFLDDLGDRVIREITQKEESPMFGIGKKLFGAKRAVKKLENRDLMQAIVGGCLLVAASDGEISKNEAAQIDIQIRANKALEHFGSEITSTVNLFTEQLQAGFRLGRMNILREIRDIKNNPADAEEVFVNMLTVAEGDGNISPEELKVLGEIGNELGLRLKDFGIEA